MLKAQAATKLTRRSDSEREKAKKTNKKTARTHKNLSSFFFFFVVCVSLHSLRSPFLFAVWEALTLCIPFSFKQGRGTYVF